MKKDPLRSSRERGKTVFSQKEGWRWGGRGRGKGEVLCNRKGVPFYYWWGKFREIDGQSRREEEE